MLRLKNFRYSGKAKLTRRPSTRAFTLLEVVIVAAVAAVVFLILIRWLSSLGAVAGAVAQNAVPTRNATYAETRLKADLGSATVCDPVAGTPLRELTDRTLELYIDGAHSDGSPGILLVRWTADSGNLTRSVFEVSVADQCLPAPGSTSASRVISTNVYTGAQTPFFQAVSSGIDQGECRTFTRPLPGTQTALNPAGTPVSTPEGAGCFAPGVQVQIAFINAGQDYTDSANWDPGVNPVRINRTLPVASTSGGL